MTPALNIPVKVDLDQFKKGMQESSALAGTATRAIAKHFIDLNASVLATSGAAGSAVLGLRSVLGVLGPLSVGITAVVGVFQLMGYATELAKEKIEEFYKVTEKAGKAGVSTDLFQRMTKSGEALKLTVDEINGALDQFARKAQGRLGGSDLEQRIAELTTNGNFTGNAGVAAVGNALGNEAKLRATVDLITDALAKGERLAALDLAEKVFGSKIADNLRANSTYLREMLTSADKIAAAKIVSAEEIGRAVDLKNRLEESQKILAERFKPIQDDLAKLGMTYQESWVGIYQNLAKAVGVADDLYAALKEIPDIFARAGSAPFWSRMTEYLKARGLTSDPASLGLMPITSTGEGSPANNKLAGLMSNPAAIRRAMLEAIDVETKVRGDLSKAPPKPVTDTSRARDPFETALDQGERRIAVLNAETATIGQNTEARERAKLVANLEEAAKRANAAAGKELYAVTEATNPKIGQQADKMLAAARAARQQQTAFDGLQDALRYSGNEVLSVLDKLGQKGTTFGSIMSDVFKNLSRQMLMAAISGEGAFAKLFGLAGSNGGVGGLFGAVSSAFTGGGALPLPGAGDFIGPVARADGGIISGPGTGRSDSIPALVSNGEFIVNAASTARHRALLETINAGAPRFADGGLVGPSAPLGAAGSNVVHVAPQISIKVEGGSQGPQADAKMAEMLGKHLDQQVRRIIGDELRTQRRPGGILR